MPSGFLFLVVEWKEAVITREEQRRLAALIQDHCWAALATQGEEGPEASWVAYVPEPGFGGFLLHLSRLASHTRNLLKDPRACLAVSEQAQPGDDPQLLARVMIQGEVEVIFQDMADYAECARRYRQQLPASEQWFGFGDFMLFRLKPGRVRFISGFARAYTLDAAELRQAAE